MFHGPVRRAPAADGAVVLDAERLDAYAVALAFQGVTAQLVQKLAGPFRDQLERASLSILVNLARRRDTRSVAPRLPASDREEASSVTYSPARWTTSSRRRRPRRCSQT
jgi:hypothetical protein